MKSDAILKASALALFLLTTAACTDAPTATRPAAGSWRAGSRP